VKILVDTSVWSHSFRRKKKSTNDSEFLNLLIENDEEIILTGIILQEILSSIKDKKLFDKILGILSDFEYIESQKDDFIYAATLQNELLRKGISCSTIDLIIASIAIKNRLFLVTFDKDFHNIAKYSSLRILQYSEYREMVE